MARALNRSPLAVRRPWKPGPYHDAGPRWSAGPAFGAAAIVPWRDLARASEPVAASAEPTITAITATVVVNRFMRVLSSFHVIGQSLLARYWMVPYHTGWHLAHHVDMGVPWTNLPRLHAELVAAGWITPAIEYPSYRAFWRAATVTPPRAT